MRYLDPKNDLTFKKIFGEHKNLCISLLNSLLPLKDDEQIEEIQYLPAELVPEIPLLKRTIVDVRCTDNNGRQFIVEMQMYWSNSFAQRVVFNASKAYVRQLEKAKEYKSLEPVYALSLVADIFEPNNQEYFHHYKIVNIENTKKQLKGLEFIFVELPKFKAKNLTEKKLQILWLRFLTEITDGTTEISKDLTDNKTIKEALECLEESSFTKKELASYDVYWDSIRTERTVQADAREEGKIETQHEIAKKLKEAGIATDIIASTTGLSKEEIETL